MSIYVEAEVAFHDADGRSFDGEMLVRFGDLVMEQMAIVATDGDVGADLEAGSLTLCFYVDASSPLRAFEENERVVTTVPNTLGVDNLNTEVCRVSARSAALVGS